MGSKGLENSNILSLFFAYLLNYPGLPMWLSDVESTRHAGDLGSTPGWGRSAGERNGNPL